MSAVSKLLVLMFLTAVIAVGIITFAPNTEVAALAASILGALIGIAISYPAIERHHRKQKSAGRTLDKTARVRYERRMLSGPLKASAGRHTLQTNQKGPSVNSSPKVPKTASKGIDESAITIGSRKLKLSEWLKVHDDLLKVARTDLHQELKVVAVEVAKPIGSPYAPDSKILEHFTRDNRNASNTDELLDDIRSDILNKRIPLPINTRPSDRMLN